MATTKVNSEFIAVNAISGTIIADGAITSTHLAANCVDSSELVTGSIDTIHIAANQVTSAKIVSDAVLTRHIADDQVTQALIAVNSVGISELAVTDGSDGQVLTTNGSGTLSFSTASGTTINNNADNRVITGSGTANTLNGEANLTFGSSLVITKSEGAANSLNDQISLEHTSGSTGYHIKTIRAASTDNPDGISFVENTTERMRIRGGNVGIGTDSPFSPLHVSKTDWSSGSPYGTVATIEGNNVNDNNWGHLIITDTTTSNDNGGSIRFATGSTSSLNPFAGIQGVAEGTSHGGVAIYTRPSGGTATERLRILSGGGLTFNGDTATANALDDYEEGTWTPAFYTYSGVTTTSTTTNYGIYTKIGRMVYIHAKLDVTLSSLPGQIVTITGLPFTGQSATADTGQRAIFAIGGDAANVGGYGNGRAHFRLNNDQLQGVYMNSGSTAYWYYNSMDSSSFRMNIHGHYAAQ